MEEGDAKGKVLRNPKNLRRVAEQENLANNNLNPHCV